MPTITLDGPIVGDLEKKRQLIAEMTAAAEKYYGLPRGTYVVVIKENCPENVGVGGRLVADL